MFPFRMMSWSFRGHNIGTAEVESALVQHAGVSEAAVVGYPDPKKNQGMYCFVILKDNVDPTEELKKDLIKTVRDIIGAHVFPDYIQFTANLPKTRSGKIMRRILRKIVEPDVGKFRRFINIKRIRVLWTI